MHSLPIISKADGRPMYGQIVEQIQRLISVGDWPRGEEIPSIRQLAVALSVSVITIKRAYLELEREGVIITQHGKPSRVAQEPDLRPMDHQAELARHLAEAARIGELMGVPPEELAARLIAAVDETKKDRT